MKKVKKVRRLSNGKVEILKTAVLPDSIADRLIIDGNQNKKVGSIVWQKDTPKKKEELKKDEKDTSNKEEESEKETGEKELEYPPLEEMTHFELKQLGKKKGLSGYNLMKRDTLIERLKQ